MELTDDIISLVTEYAEDLMTPAEIAILLAIPPADRTEFVVRCRTHVGDELYEAFNIGRLKTKRELRRNIIKLAKAGSPAAEPLAERFIREQNLD